MTKFTINILGKHLKIPKNFTLGAVDWKVEETSPIPDSMGVCWSSRALVQLDSELPLQVKEQTFAHELVHCILYAMGKTQHDEEFVDGFATFLHQFLKTAK